MRSTSPILHSPCLTSPLDSESEDPSEIPRAVFKYKKVSQKVRPVFIQIPEDQQPKRQFPQDPLLNPLNTLIFFEPHAENYVTYATLTILNIEGGR